MSILTQRKIAVDFTISDYIFLGIIILVLNRKTDKLFFKVVYNYHCKLYKIPLATTATIFFLLSINQSIYIHIAPNQNKCYLKTH